MHFLNHKHDCSGPHNHFLDSRLFNNGLAIHYRHCLVAIFFIVTFILLNSQLAMLLLLGQESSEMASFAREFANNQLKAHAMKLSAIDQQLEEFEMNILNEDTFKQLLPKMDETTPILLERGFSVGIHQEELKKTIQERNMAIFMKDCRAGDLKDYTPVSPGGKYVAVKNREILVIEYPDEAEKIKTSSQSLSGECSGTIQHNEEEEHEDEDGDNEEELGHEDNSGDDEEEVDSGNEDEVDISEEETGSDKDDKGEGIEHEDEDEDVKDSDEKCLARFLLESVCDELSEQESDSDEDDEKNRPRSRIRHDYDEPGEFEDTQQLLCKNTGRSRRWHKHATKRATKRANRRAKSKECKKHQFSSSQSYRDVKLSKKRTPNGSSSFCSFRVSWEATAECKCITFQSINIGMCGGMSHDKSSSRGYFNDNLSIHIIPGPNGTEEDHPELDGWTRTEACPKITAHPTTYTHGEETNCELNLNPKLQCSAMISHCRNNSEQTIIDDFSVHNKHTDDSMTSWTFYYTVMDEGRKWEEHFTSTRRVKELAKAAKTTKLFSVRAKYERPAKDGERPANEWVEDMHWTFRMESVFRLLKRNRMKKRELNETIIHEDKLMISI